MRASLFVVQALVTLPFLGLISLVSADDHLKMWIDPSCKTEQVQAINEARWLSKRMDENLGNQDLDFFEDTFGWFFGINSNDRLIIRMIRNTYARIGAVERVLDRKDSKLRVYCDNQKGFVPANEGQQAPPDGSNEFKSMPFKWDQEEVAALGSDLACRMNDALGVTTNTAEKNWIKRGFTPSKKPEIPSDRVIMWICDKNIRLTQFSYTTSQAVKHGILESSSHVGFAMMGSWTTLHELSHVNALSNQQYYDGFTELSLPQGVDSFASDIADPKSPKLWGYLEPGKIPGHVLKVPWRTVVNPDSYAFFALAWQLQSKQHVMFQQNEDLKWRKDTNLLLRPDPDWSDPNGGINWSNDPTPEGHASKQALLGDPSISGPS